MQQDAEGFRLNVGIILLNQQERVFWGQRIQRDSWQFPQGGISNNESLVDSMYRELYEEVGLKDQDVTIVSQSQNWYSYKLPEQYMRKNNPKVLGQKQKWFLLKLQSDEEQICLNKTECPEFLDWVWVDYWYPIQNVIFFKREVYKKVLDEFKVFLTNK